MPTISFLNQKGGSGKTTMSINIACCLSKRGFNVLLVDSDPQGSARDWNEENEGEVLNVVGLDRKTLAKDIKPFQSQYDYVVIDGAPQITELSGAAVKVSDIVLMPVQPSPYDIWACADLVDVLKSRQEVTNGKPQAAFVISRVIKNTKLSKEVSEALASYEIAVFESFTSQRVSYPTMAGKGESVLESSDSGAIDEIEAITNEIIKGL